MTFSNRVGVLDSVVNVVDWMRKVVQVHGMLTSSPFRYTESASGICDSFWRLF